ncbi:MAG: 50S ribosomal protein L23 [bacterium]|nr:50S ribosomal protein L23 [bacterium]
MSLFGKKKEKAIEKVSSPTETKSLNEEKRLEAGDFKTQRDLTGVLLHPKVTEKSGILSEHNAYAFEISSVSTKRDVAAAIWEFYKVRPVKVNILRRPGKSILYRGKVGKKKSVKKAYVFLKKGDKIEIA